MFVFKKTLTLYLAQTKPPKAVYDHVSFASQVTGPYFATAIQGKESEDYCDPTRQGGRQDVE
jgi:hypothetical protein